MIFNEFIVGYVGGFLVGGVFELIKGLLIFVIYVLWLSRSGRNCISVVEGSCYEENYG